MSDLQTETNVMTEINTPVDPSKTEEISSLTCATENDIETEQVDKCEVIEEATEDTTPASSETAFKVPLIIKGQKACPPKHTAVDTETEPNSMQKARGDLESTNEKPSSRVIGPSLCPNALPNQTSEKIPEKNTVSLAYKEPSWSGSTDKAYKFEVIKGGVVVNVVELNTKPYYVVGRMSTTDVMLEHPSISRHHAVIQYRLVGDEEHPEGFYLYDLESTHGTTLNKQAVRPRSYYRLRVGYMIKFGGSTRMFILQGPDEDQDAESVLTVTELKDLRKKQEEQLARIEKAEEDSENDVNEEEKEKNEQTGIDWGMGEDAVDDEEEEEDDENIDDINPFALGAYAPNESLYIDDPKKTLRGWFEREGYDLEYRVEEKGYSQFLCRIQLPLDGLAGGPTFAEAMVKGKKKEAVVACALEACRLLDKHGLLRQANHESRKRKLKNWEEEDYYDSDEDTFLDRTGTIEKKRQQRIQRAGKEKKTVETFETLSAQLDSINKEIAQMEMMIEKSHKTGMLSVDKDVDSLDAYMSSIGNRNEIDKCSLSAHKVRLSQLRQEETKLQRLIAIARPTHLPELRVESTNVSENVVTVKKPLPMIGSMKGRGIKTRIAPAPVKKIIQPVQVSIDKEEEKIANEKQTDVPIDDVKEDTTDEITTIEEPKLEKKKEIENKEKNVQIDRSESNAINKLPKHSKCRRKKFKSELNYVYDATNPDYALWMPPDNQSGDGRTRLNDKYGY